MQVILSTNITRTPRVAQVQGLFDLPPAQRSEKTWSHTLDLPPTWNIGVILGPSGSGKTTLARHLFGDYLIDKWNWPQDQSILDGFPPEMSIKTIVELLCSVGFSSPPSWVRPFHALSNGEQFRVHLARTLAEMPDLAVVDEFTSVVDRTVARIGSAAVAKTVRRRNQKFIAITCHYDVLEWLTPDWIYQPHTSTFERAPSPSPPLNAHGTAVGLPPSPDREYLHPVPHRPPIPLEITRTPPSAWRLFSPHHYLSSALHPSAACYIALMNNHPAAFVAVLPFPHPTRPGWREHRCVCLPDFQGVGIGHALSEFVASLYAATGRPYRSTTSHPGMISHRRRCGMWKMTRPPTPGTRQKNLHTAGSLGRLIASFQYTGPLRVQEAHNFGLKISRHSKEPNFNGRVEN